MRVAERRTRTRGAREGRATETIRAARQRAPPPADPKRLQLPCAVARRGPESVFFFFQAEDGIRDDLVTGVQTCALPIFRHGLSAGADQDIRRIRLYGADHGGAARRIDADRGLRGDLEGAVAGARRRRSDPIGRASGREKGESSGGPGSFKKKK